MKKAYPDLDIVIDVEYVGIQNGNHVWITQILGVESEPKKFYRSVKDPKYSISQVVAYIATWYKSPHG